MGAARNVLCKSHNLTAISLTNRHSFAEQLDADNEDSQSDAIRTSRAPSNPVLDTDPGEAAIAPSSPAVDTELGDQGRVVYHTRKRGELKFILFWAQSCWLIPLERNA